MCLCINKPHFVLNELFPGWSCSQRGLQSRKQAWLEPRGDTCGKWGFCIYVAWSRVGWLKVFHSEKFRVRPITGKTCLFRDWETSCKYSSLLNYDRPLADSTLGKGEPWIMALLLFILMLQSMGWPVSEVTKEPSLDRDSIAERCILWMLPSLKASGIGHWEGNDPWLKRSCILM